MVLQLKQSVVFRTHFCILVRYLGEGHDAVDRTIRSLRTLFKGPDVYLADILISMGHAVA
jgi:hypothetical protein